MGLVHLDIKPAKHEGGRLLIIDYNCAVRFTGKRRMLRGITGTEGYAAESGVWSAIRADLWSTGKTPQELCMLCDSSATHER